MAQLQTGTEPEPEPKPLPEQKKPPQPIASFKVSDAYRYENDHHFNQRVNYHIQPVGEYIGLHSDFVAVPKHDEYPRLIPNIHSLTDQDLNKGFQTLEHHVAKTQQFLDVLKQQYHQFDMKQSGIQFVTFRNNLNKIMAAPYFHSRPEYDAFAIDIVKMDGILYLEIVDRETLLDNAKKDSNEDESKKDAMPEWWGRRFEQICTTVPKQSDSDKSESEEKQNDSDGYDAREFIILVQSQLNSHRILMAAEIDCINEQNEYVEIKTNKYILPKVNRYQRRSFGQHVEKASENNVSGGGHYGKQKSTGSEFGAARAARYHPYEQKRGDKSFGGTAQPIIAWYKTLKIWIQSYLAGVNNVLIGFRDDKGMVVKVDTFKLEWFARKINYFDRKRQKRISKSNVCLNFTDRVLNFVKEHCKSEGTAYRLLFNAPWNELRLYTK